MKNIALSFLYALCFLVFISTRWLINTYGESLSFDNFLFHLFIGVEGADDGVIFSFLNKALLASLKAWIYIFLVLYIKQWIFHPSELQTKLLAWIKKSLEFLSNILRRKLFLLAILVSSLGFFGYKLKVADFISNLYGKDIFVEYYKEPLIETKKSDTKNLILIYVESLENTYRNKEVYGKNIIKLIDDLPGHHIDYFINAPGTNWSLAGMTSSQCGIPLKPILFNEIGKKSFLPGVTCLGDILAKNNYTQYFLTNVLKQFGGIDALYYDHGYQNVIGLDEWEERGVPTSLYTGFGEGLQDDTLLDEATKIIKDLDKENKPYNVSFITCDTHATYGFPSPRCLAQERISSFPGAVKCSSRFIADFVRNLEKDGLLKNTVIVIMGDHLFMENKHQKHLFPDPRYVYFKFISPDENMIPRRNKLNHFDIAPSILHLMGINSKENDRFGLGISLFSDISEEEYEKHFQAVTSNKILNHSDLYNSFYKSK